MTKKVHLIGICGAGMSAVAHLLQQKNFIVSGSDEGFYPPISDYIERLGIPCHAGYAKENIPSDVDLIVIGKNARLIPETNEEVRFAFDNHRKSIKSFPEVLADLSKDRSRTVIAGSYGKSTLTSIIAWCLIDAGKDPGFFIGAIPKNLDNSSTLGSGSHFIFEGDEYPSANWDDRSKFLHYTPDTVILTSACHDHVNIFPTLASYHQPFNALLSELESNHGNLVACTDEENAREFYNQYAGKKTSYGLGPASNWHADNITPSDETVFTLIGHGEAIGKISTTMLGKHNIQNIVGAAAWLIGDGILSFDAFSSAVSRFDGLDRRLDLKSDRTALPIYEGFGSSYEKARSAITAIVDHYRDRDLTVLFEPHTFSWRNKSRLDQYQTAFNNAKRVYLYQPAAQGADTHAQLTLDEIYQETTAHHPDVRLFDVQNFKDIITNSDPDKDAVLILSSGSFDGLLQKVIEEAERQFPRA